MTPARAAYGTVPVVVQSSGGSTTVANGFTYAVPRGTGIEQVGQSGGTPYALEFQGNYLYVGEGNALAIYDITNPFTPTRLGRIALPGFANDRTGERSVCVRR